MFSLMQSFACLEVLHPWLTHPYFGLFGLLHTEFRSYDQGLLKTRIFLHDESSVQGNFVKSFGTKPAEKFGDSPQSASCSIDREEASCLIDDAAVDDPVTLAKQLVQKIKLKEQIFTEEIDAFFSVRGRYLCINFILFHITCPYVL